MTSFHSARRTFLAAALTLAALPALADETKAPVPGLISVSAEGIVAVAPDMAILSLTVLRDGKTARAALDANNVAMGEVLAAMKADGIEARDLQTGGFSVQPRWVYPAEKNGTRKPPFIDGYEVRNTLTVRVRDLDKVGAVLDSSVTLGVNESGTVIFTNDDPEPARAAARKDAVEKALAKAKAMTEPLGVGLGRIMQISEDGFSRPPMPMAKMAADSRVAMAEAVPVAAGENEYRISVSVTWEIAQ